MIEPVILDGGRVKLYQGDCLAVLPTLEVGSVDAVVTDPPYGIGFAKSPTKWSRVHINRKPEAWDDVVPDMSTVLRLGAPTMIWGGNHFALPPSRGWLVWAKPDGLPTYGTAELCWTNVEMPVRHFWHDRPHNRGCLGHPTQKPLPLMEWCLSFLPDAHTILDPFMGSGTTGVACIRTGRSFIGIEISEEYFNIARTRIEKELDARNGTGPLMKAAGLFGGNDGH